MYSISPMELILKDISSAEKLFLALTQLRSTRLSSDAKCPVTVNYSKFYCIHTCMLHLSHSPQTSLLFYSLSVRKWTESHVMEIKLDPSILKLLLSSLAQGKSNSGTRAGPSAFDLPSEIRNYVIFNLREFQLKCAFKKSYK